MSAFQFAVISVTRDRQLLTAQGYTSLRQVTAHIEERCRHQPTDRGAAYTQFIVVGGDAVSVRVSPDPDTWPALYRCWPGVAELHPEDA